MKDVTKTCNLLRAPQQDMASLRGRNFGMLKAKTDTYTFICSLIFKRLKSKSTIQVDL